MTREERNNAIKVLKNYDLNNLKVNSLLFSAEDITNAFDMAIEALEQQPVLDKIRAEIIELRSKQNVGVLECLDIIDKYRAESEE